LSNVIILINFTYESYYVLNNFFYLELTNKILFIFKMLKQKKIVIKSVKRKISRGIVHIM